jgi:dihydrofolate synthase/folylpolyglutamate synthase
VSLPDPILERLKALHPKVIDLSLDRVLRLLDRLGRPQDQLPPVVHIAGTNGKGSTLSFLGAIAEAAGWRVHRYTSPHLVRFNERIVLAGEEITDPALGALLDEVERVNEGAPITFFEVTTAAAFLAFARAPADLLLLETGLGGRLDATNVVARPALCVITPVGMDHEAFLGDTLAAIAREKAGILKRDVPAVVAPQLSEAMAVLTARAREIGAPLSCYGQDWSVAPAPTGMTVVDRGERLDLPAPVLPGTHQIANAGTAVVAARRLGGPIADPAALAAGLRHARWPARLQRLRSGPLLDALPSGWELWLDGGHNPSAGDALAASLSVLGGGRPWRLVVGMLATKDNAGFLRPLADRVEATVTIPVPGEPNGIDAVALAEIAARVGHQPVQPAADAAEAIAILRGSGGPSTRVLITGSLYLAGAILRDHR